QHLAGRKLERRLGLQVLEAEPLLLQYHESPPDATCPACYRTGVSCIPPLQTSSISGERAWTRFSRVLIRHGAWRGVLLHREQRHGDNSDRSAAPRVFPGAGSAVSDEGGVLRPSKGVFPAGLRA